MSRKKERHTKRGLVGGGGGDPGIYGLPGSGQTHRDAPLTPRGEWIWTVVLGLVLGIAAGVVLYIALT